MKMNLFDKFLLALILFVLLAVSLFIGCISIGVVPLGIISEYLQSIAGPWQINGLIFGGIALLLFVTTIRLLVANYSSDKSQSYTKLSVTEDGVIAISIPTIKQIAAAFIATKPDIAASSSVILPVKGALVVSLRICVKESVMLPEVTKAIQKELKAHLEMVTGLVIKEIRVDVDNNRTNYSGKGR